MGDKYSVSVDSKRRVVEVRFVAAANFNLIEKILRDLKQ